MVFFAKYRILIYDFFVNYRILQELFVNLPKNSEQ